MPVERVRSNVSCHFTLVNRRAGPVRRLVFAINPVLPEDRNGRERNPAHSSRLAWNLQGGVEDELECATGRRRYQGFPPQGVSVESVRTPDRRKLDRTLFRRAFK